MKLYQYLKEDREERLFKRWILDGRGLKGNQYIVYHGTTESRSKAILKSGLKEPSGAYSPSWYMVTTSKKVAKDEFAKGYANETDRPVVLKITIPKDKIRELLFAGQETSYKDIQHALKKAILPKYIKKD